LHIRISQQTLKPKKKIFQARSGAKERLIKEKLSQKSHATVLFTRRGRNKFRKLRESWRTFRGRGEERKFSIREDRL
jgi:ribosomal protein L32E